jgi:hypothetical protein
MSSAATPTVPTLTPLVDRPKNQQVSVAVTELDVAITVPFESCRVKVQVDEVPSLGTNRGPLVDPGLITPGIPLPRVTCSMGPKAKLNEVPTASPVMNHTWKPGIGARGPPFSPVAVKLIFGWQLLEGGLVVVKKTELMTIDRPGWLAWAADGGTRTTTAAPTVKAAHLRMILTWLLNWSMRTTSLILGNQTMHSAPIGPPTYP